MSLLSENVSTIASFEQVVNTVVQLGPETVISPGVNFVTLTGSCTPNALNTNFVLLDTNSDPLNLQNYIILSITVSSNPPVVVTKTTPTDILFEVVGLNYPALTGYTVYWNGTANMTASEINSKRFSITVLTKGGPGPGELNNLNYPVPAIRATNGPGTIDSGTIYVSFHCAALL